MIAFRAPGDNAGSSPHLRTLNFITFVKFLLPWMVTFMGPRDLDLDVLGAIPQLATAALKGMSPHYGDFGVVYKRVTTATGGLSPVGVRGSTLRTTQIVPESQDWYNPSLEVLRPQGERVILSSAAPSALCPHWFLGERSREMSFPSSHL